MASVSKAAIALAISPDTLRDWIRDGCPTWSDNGVLQVDLEKARKWAKDNGKRKADVAAGAPNTDDAKGRKLLAEAQLAEAKLAKIKGELVHYETYRQLWLENVKTLQVKLLGLGSSLAAQLVGQDASEIETQILARVHQIFRELSDPSPSKVNGSDD
jgi:phage terminase Nu1 subunit (DNA packaging protein)